MIYNNGKEHTVEKGELHQSLGTKIKREEYFPCGSAFVTPYKSVVKPIETCIPLFQFTTHSKTLHLQCKKKIVTLSL